MYWWCCRGGKTHISDAAAVVLRIADGDVIRHDVIVDDGYILASDLHQRHIHFRRPATVVTDSDITAAKPIRAA